MKKLLQITLIIASVNAHAVDNPSYSLPEAIQYGEASLDLSIGYFDRSFEDPGKQNAKAFSAGNIAKYQSASFHNFKLGLTYFGSHSLFGIIDRDKGKDTAYLRTNGHDISFLGEAYIDFNSAVHQIKLGRQRLSTPLMDDHNIRLLPSSYEALVYRNKSITDTTIELAIVKRYSGFASKLSKFKSPDAKWGNNGLAYIFVTYKLIDITIRGQFIDTIDNSGSQQSFHYIDVNKPLAFGDKSYIKSQFGGTNYRKGDTSRMFGLKTGTSLANFDIAFSFNSIRKANFQTVQSGPMYTDWQQGYGLYEPSNAYAIQLVFHPNSQSNIKIGYVNVDGKNGSRIDDYGEFNLDAKYNITQASSFRLRYSVKDQKHEGVKGRYDRDDLRLYYYYNF